MVGHLTITGLELALLLNFKRARLEWKRVVRQQRPGSGSPCLSLLYPRHPRKPRFQTGKKSFKKSRKKACQPLASSARPEMRATNSTVWPFKKSTKKVKKKLVRSLEI
jgi:hypothetical protein